MTTPTRTLAMALAGAALASGIALLGWRAAAQQRVADYAPPSFEPRYAGGGPAVGIDAGHREMHALAGSYAPLGRLLRQDGMRVRAIVAAPLSPDALAGVDVLVVANARPPGEAEDALANGAQAFQEAEIDVLDAWVSKGGALLLVADHHPFGGYVRTLSERFGVRMSGGYAADPANANPAADDDGQVLFRRANGGLGAHWITAPLATVQGFTGQALQSAPGDCLLRFGATSERHAAIPTRRGDDVVVRLEKVGSAEGWCQAVARPHGRGRVVVLGEAAMITAQVDRSGAPFGMQLPGDDNELFALQVVRWLARGDAADGRRGAAAARTGADEGDRSDD